MASTFTGCVSVSAFASLVDVSVRITSSAFGLKIFVITARLKKSISITKKKIQKTWKNGIYSKTIFSSKGTEPWSSFSSSFSTINFQ